MTQSDRLRLAVFIDFDNIEIGVKNTLNAQFDAGLVLEALKERGEVVSKMAYSDWQRAGHYSRALTQHAIRMVQRNLTPGGDKNGADINLALDALEMAFTHPHINAFVIVGGDSDFISLVEKLKQYDKKVFVVGGRQFTSVIMQRNCHEFIAYENLVGAGGGRRATGQPAVRVDKPSLDQVVPLVRRALQVLSERDVSPQLGLLKSTLLQLDSTFSEKSFGAGSFREFAQKLERIGVLRVHQGKGGWLVGPADAAATEPAAGEDAEREAAAAAGREAQPHRDRDRGRDGGRDTRDGREARDTRDTRDGRESREGRDARRDEQPRHEPHRGHGHRDEERPRPAGGHAAEGEDEETHVRGSAGAPADGVREFGQILARAQVRRWPLYPRNVKQILKQVNAGFDERAYGFANLTDLLRAAQKAGVIRIERDRQGVIRVFQANLPAVDTADPQGDVALAASTMGVPVIGGDEPEAEDPARSVPDAGDSASDEDEDAASGGASAEPAGADASDESGESDQAAADTGAEGEAQARAEGGNKPAKPARRRRTRAAATASKPRARSSSRKPRGEGQSAKK